MDPLTEKSKAPTVLIAIGFCVALFIGVAAGYQLGRSSDTPKVSKASPAVEEILAELRKDSPDEGKIEELSHGLTPKQEQEFMSAAMRDPVILENSMNTTKEKARDATRISDIKNLQLALEIYYDAHEAYPATLDMLVPVEIPTLPSDPKTEASYLYYSAWMKDPKYCYKNNAPCSFYHLGASLEKNIPYVLEKDADRVSPVFNGKDTAGCKGEKGLYCFDYDSVSF